MPHFDPDNPNDAEATRIGYALARTSITLPTYQKG